MAEPWPEVTQLTGAPSPARPHGRPPSRSDGVICACAEEVKLPAQQGTAELGPV